MSTYTQFLYQLVFSTKERNPSLTKSNRKQLYKYLWGILKNKECHLYRINGVEDHLHIITHIHPTVPVSTLIKDLKTSSNKYIRKEGLFPEFAGWQDGYGAFSYSIKAKDRLIEYVKNQEEHHKTVTFREEYIALLKEHEIEFDERYLLSPFCRTPSGFGFSVSINPRVAWIASTPPVVIHISPRSGFC